MVIINLKGGLGNQMFQYAYAKSLNLKGYKVYMDISNYDEYKLHGGYQLDKYNISLPVIKMNKLIKKIIEKNYLKYFIKKEKEENLLFNETYLYPNKNCFIEGYFQSEKYFSHIRNILLQEFKLKYYTEYTNRIEEMIIKSNTSCSIHIRRGDYLNNNNINIHGVCDLSYYLQAIEIIKLKNKDIKFFVFSDDIEWAKKNLKIKNVVFIENKANRLPHEDIYLMSLCNHNIIANSSFSWWGAWLNEYNYKIVIAPKKWFADKVLNNQAKDIYCNNWIRI